MAAVTEARSSVSALTGSVTVVFAAREHKVPRRAGQPRGCPPENGQFTDSFLVQAARLGEILPAAI